MIDIKESAEIKASIKELYNKGLSSVIKEEMLLDRILVFPLVDEKELDSSIIIDDHKRREMKSGELQKAVVKKVGQGKPFEVAYYDKNGEPIILYNTPNLKEGDIVYVYPNCQEGLMTIEGVCYVIYFERNIIAKIPF